MDILNEAKKVENFVIDCRRYLHTIPEPGIDLPNTYSFVKSKLDELGIEYEEHVGLKHGLVGTINGSKPGKVIALRADMDALPIKEETGLDFSSTNGSMHACGHDGHTSILLGAAKILNENKNLINGTIKLIFQPGEEISAGAKPIANSGILESPNVDAVFGMHIGCLVEDMKPGQIAINEGSMMASLDAFTIKVKGKGAHGASPHLSIDPVVVSSYIITALQEILSREIDAVEPGLLTVGILKAGSAYNIIPDEAYIEGTARGVKEETRKLLAKRIEEISRGIAESFRAEVEFNFKYGAPPVINNREFTKLVRNSVTELLGEEAVYDMNKPIMIGEDFSEYLQKVPGTFVFLYNPLEIDGKIYPHHNCKFALDETKFVNGVALLTKVVFDFLNN